ncbi:MAG: hypothetical protein AAF387_04630 [Pseudomonadota bacterium]
MTKVRTSNKRLMLTGATAWLLLSILASPAIARTVLIAYVGPQDTTAERGLKQGLIEANVQGEFLDTKYELLSLNAKSEPTAIIVSARDEEIIQIAKNFPATPIFNVSNKSDYLRSLCLENVFHTIPSQQMFSDAAAQWRQKHAASNAEPQAWHRTFRKYAAAQLNIRYHETFNADMDDNAWAGWAATKLLADTLVRAPELLNERLINELKTNVAFDGQKGIDMSFRETGQLAQPLLLVADDKIVGEAPVRGVVDITDLNSLGQLNCPK